MFQAELVELKASGLPFSWNNKSRSGIRTLSRIDHSFSNLAARKTWPALHQTLLPPLLSDHSPIIIHLCDVDKKRKNTFKFFNSWAEESDFLDVINSVWIKPVFGNPLFILQVKLKAVKAALIPWSRNRYGYGSKQSDYWKQKLEEEQVKMLADNNYNFQACMEAYLIEQYQSALVKEDDMIKQKARIKWNQQGDRNSEYFHASLRNKQYGSNIIKIKDSQGNLQETKSEVQKAFIDHFSNLFGNATNFEPDIDSINPHLLPKLDQQQYEFLCLLVDSEEVKKAMFSLNRKSSCGPDGLNAFFFFHCWNIVESVVCKAVKHFFKTANLHQFYNNTNIALIPKTKHADEVGDFRPISCCNTIYKCITKIIALRMKSVLPSLISNNQAAFLNGSNILDNVMLAQELLNGYKRRSVSPSAMLKLDIMKAFDMLQWNTIVRVLGYMNFPHHFVSWIYACLTNVNFSVVINGENSGYFRSRQGIRQGDPISAYVFILIMEMLTRMIDSLVEEGKFKLHPKCIKQRITTLMFADDLVLFCKPELSTIQEILRTLNKFHAMTGLKINLNKSELRTAGIDEDMHLALQRTTGLIDSNQTMHYLGLPLITSRITTTQCLPLFQRISAKLNNWANRLLSQAGRVTLVKSVLFSIQVYWARAFVLPGKLLKLLRTTFMRFIWNGRMEGRFMSPVSYNKTESPLCKGGLGLLNIKVWNKAAMTKLLNDVISNKDGLWNEWSRLYIIKDKSFWVMEAPQNLSWTWRSLFKLREQVLPHYQSKIGINCTTKFWDDPWICAGLILRRELTDLEMLQTGLRQLKLVADIIHSNSVHLPPSSNARIHALWSRAAELPVLADSGDDLGLWGPSKMRYSVGMMYRLLSDSDSLPKCKWYKVIWFKDNIQRENLLLWKVRNYALLTKVLLRDRGMFVEEECVFCRAQPENIDHLYFECNFTFALLKMFFNMFGGNVCNQDNNRLWEDLWSMIGVSSRKRRLFNFVLKKVVSEIWNERNGRVFSSAEPRTNGTIAKAISRSLRDGVVQLNFTFDPGILKQLQLV